MESEMTLREKQSKFVRMVAKLLRRADSLGYELTFGNARLYAGQRNRRSKNSLHFIGLAIDLNLFLDGVYLNKNEDHKPLGEFWESIGGSWGGRFKDGNHYSLEHNGKR